MSDILDPDVYISQLKQRKLLTQTQLEGLIKQVKEVLSNEPNVVLVPVPVTVVGDIHGQFYDLMELFKICGDAPETNYLFLGDYVDRGSHSVECFSLVLALKLRFKSRVTILRGNHESCEINKIYGFYDECFKKYGNESVWRLFTDVFMFLPLSALVGNKIFCVHGGLSPSIAKIDDIAIIKRLCDVPYKGPICDLLWSDPDEIRTGFTPSPRAAGFIFGLDITERFLYRNDLNMITRAHQLVMDGYTRNHKKRVITIFSAPNYCCRCDNQAAVMEINENLKVSYIQYLQAENASEPKLSRRCPDYFL